MRLLVSLLLLLALPATAAASDASLERKWTRYLDSPHRLFAISGDHDEFAIITRAGELRPVRRALRRNARLVGRTRRAVRGDSPTSETGAGARRAALDCLRESAFGLRRYRRAIRLVADPPERAAERFERLLRPASKALLKADDLERRATRLFRRVT